MNAQVMFGFESTHSLTTLFSVCFVPLGVAVVRCGDEAAPPRDLRATSRANKRPSDDSADGGRANAITPDVLFISLSLGLLLACFF